MTLQKLESYTNKEIIKEEVEILTTILEDIAKNLVSPETFDKILELKKLSVSKDYLKLDQIVRELSNEEMIVISRYFAILPLLINISEDVDLAFEINHQNNVGQDYLGKLSSTIRQVAETENAQEILERLNVVPVLTAHPTQVQRKTMLDLTTQIHSLLRQHRDVKAGLMNETKWYNNLRRNIEIMMQTDMIREKKLKVTNEITNVMEYYNSSFLQAVPNLMLEYKRLAKEQGIELQQPKPITMGMWIGGDRDGNPFVTAETLKRSATIQSEVILNYYIQKISSLYRNFSLSTNLSKTSQAVEEMAARSSDTSVFREKEPYRRAFHYIQSKLVQTLLNIKEWSVVGSTVDERHPIERLLGAHTHQQGVVKSGTSIKDPQFFLRGVNLHIQIAISCNGQDAPPPGQRGDLLQLLLGKGILKDLLQLGKQVTVLIKDKFIGGQIKEGSDHFHGFRPHLIRNKVPNGLAGKPYPHKEFSGFPQH